MKTIVLAFAVAIASIAYAGLFDSAWLKGTTNKNPLFYLPGEEMVFTVVPQSLEGEVPEGEYSLSWTRSDDYGSFESGSRPFTGEPFVYRTCLDKPGFVRLEVNILDSDGQPVLRRFVGDSSTPEGRKALNEFERGKKSVFFDGGAGVEIDTLAAAPEPDDFDAFWQGQFARLDRVPVKADMVEVPFADDRIRCYAIRVDCAGLRPVTGYLQVPKGVDEGCCYPCRLELHGYDGDNCRHPDMGEVRADEIKLNINAHGLKLPEFGATEADRKALRWEIRSHDCAYAFDRLQNEDPEVAYFNGMVLRVKRGLQYLKTVKGWDGKNLIASGGSQGGLQTIWAAGCGEGVTRAESGITWCCDMSNNNVRRDRQISSDGWYVPWTESMGYYDAVNWAKRIPLSCRTVILRAGLGDYCCPPMGLAKLWNNIPGNKQITWTQGSEHAYVPPFYAGRDFVREVE